MSLPMKTPAVFLSTLTLLLSQVVVANASSSDNTSETQRNSSRQTVSVVANTGHNSANKNIGGSVRIRTGNSSVNVSNNSIFNSHSNRMGYRHWSPFNRMTSFTVLTGNQEVPGPGDPNGIGSAKVELLTQSRQICVHLRVRNIQAATDAHIHSGSVGVAGPPIVHLPVPNQNGHANGCVNATRQLIREIRNNPEMFYINIHNNEYPNGAVRGQLTN